MKGTIFLSISALVYTITTTILFFRKDTINKLENRIFKKLLVITILSIVFELAIIPVINISGLNEIVPRIFFTCILLWLAVFVLYSFAVTSFNEKISESENINKYKNAHILFMFINLILCILIFVLPIQYVNGEYISGPAVNVLFITLAVYLVFIIGLVLTHIKKIHTKGYIPIFALIILLIVEGIVQKIHPEMLLANAVFSFIVYLMYHTIENPDIKMLNELYKNRELMEQGYEDKYNFLFEMTQDAKKPLLDLNRVTGELRQEDDPKKIKEGLMVINNLTRQLDFSINDVLNISSFDIQKLKIVNTKYDVLKVCDGLNTTMKGEIKKGVTFNMDLPKTAPILYGDYMKLRQILYSLLNNASKNTDNGSINLRLNTIEKYDFCRLIFNISDTGKGMSIEKINDILSATGELDKNELEILERKEFNIKVCQKVVKIMGGNLMIKSTVGMGTEVTLTLDQRVYHEKETSILNQYENDININKKVLIVAQDKDLSNYIKRKLNNNDISYSSLAFGGDAVDRIKAGKEYDYILVEDDMKEMTGLATLQELKKLKGFNIPVIVMLNESKDSIKDHYLKDGFTDYLLTNNVEEEIKRIMEKY